jgi:hypothetical protein
MLTVFIIGAMLFFLYAEVSILISKVSIYEKLLSFVIWLLLEGYYILQLMENHGS